MPCQLWTCLEAGLACRLTRTRSMRRSVDSNTSKRNPFSSKTSPALGMCPASSLTSPAMVVASFSSGRTPCNFSSRSTSVLPLKIYEDSLSFTTSDFSCSSRISPTISSTRSSMVTRPATPPYSSMTMAMRMLSRCISRSSSLPSLVSGTKYTLGFIKSRTVLVRASVSRTCKRSFARWVGLGEKIPFGLQQGALRVGARVRIQDLQEVLRIHNTFDMVDLAFTDRYARIGILLHQFGKFLDGGVDGDRDDLGPGRHHLPHRLVAEFDDGLDKIAVALLQNALFLTGFDQRVNRLRRMLRLLSGMLFGERCDRQSEAEYQGHRHGKID